MIQAHWLLGLFTVFLFVFTTQAGESLDVDTSALFDGDETTVWRATETQPSVTIDYVGCFDQVSLLPSVDPSHSIAGMLIHEEVSYGWKLVATRRFPCPNNDKTDVFRISEEICDKAVRMTFFSCSEEYPEVREITLESVVGAEVRAFSGSSKKRVRGSFLTPPAGPCTLNPGQTIGRIDCTDYYIAHTQCYNNSGLGQCIVPECLVDADCTNPAFPVCDTGDLNILAVPPYPRNPQPVPTCVRGCVSDDDCTHLYRFPSCVTGTCQAFQCLSDFDCVDSDFPVCVSGTCTAACTSDLPCQKYFRETTCLVVDPTGAGCVFGDPGCPVGRCVEPICRENSDCTTPTYPKCVPNGSSFVAGFSGVGTPSCVGCTNHDDCVDHYDYPFCQIPALASSGWCAEIDCVEDHDCDNWDDSHCYIDLTQNEELPYCGDCFEDVHCTHLLGGDYLKIACYVPDGYCYEPECVENDDCPPDEPICYYNIDDGGYNECVTGCTSDDDCAQYDDAKCHLLSGECRFGNCFENDDCTNPQNPVCNLTAGSLQYICVTGCTHDDNCTQFPPYYDASANQGYYYRCVTYPTHVGFGQCVPTCTENDHCRDPNNPICGSTFVGTGFDSRYCQPGCTSPQDCTQFTENWWCENGICILPECVHNPDQALANSACTDPLLPYCGTDNHCAAGCSNNDECTHFRDEVFCDTADGTCVTPVCRFDVDCPDPDFPTCSFPQAGMGATVPVCYAGCMTDDDCSHYATHRTCDAGRCIVAECRENDDCESATLSRCSGGTCVSCSWHSDCEHLSGDYNFCVPGTGCIVPVCEYHSDCNDTNFPTCTWTTARFAGPPVAPACIAACRSTTYFPSASGAHTDGCAQFVDNVWCSAAGTCIDPMCLDNDDCPSFTASACDTTVDPPACVPCGTNDDCAHFASRPICDAGVCVEASCNEDSDCPPERPNCDVQGGSPIPQCYGGASGCVDDEGCVQYAEETICIGGSCVPPRCRNDFDCPSFAPLCQDSLSGPDCFPCTQDNDCNRFYDMYKRVQLPILCLGGSCLAPACTVNSECTDVIASRCNITSCVSCITDDDCSQFTHTDMCLNGVCVVGECRENQDCLNPALPHCDTSTLTCTTGCNSNDECTHFFRRVCSGGVCLVEGTVPAECFESDDCLDPTEPFCRLGATVDLNDCVAECQSNDECEHFSVNTWCSTDAGTLGQCIIPACEDNEDCPDPLASRCSIQTIADFDVPQPDPSCGGCLSDDDCAHIAFYSWCNNSQCTIPPCNENSDCLNPMMPICNWANHTCVTGCTDNDQCTRFADEVWCSTEVGYVDALGNTIPVGACFDPECLTNYDCPDPRYPTCIADGEDDLNPYCTNLCTDKRSPDVHNDDCTRFDYEIWCTLRGTCEIPGCLENSDCVDPTKPSCDLAQDPPKCSNVCQSDDDCTHFAEESVCVTDRSDRREIRIWGTCVKPECETNYDCWDPRKPVCNWLENPPICAAICKNDDDCAHYGPCAPGQNCTTVSDAEERYVCVTNRDVAFDSIRGSCVVPECLENDDCEDPASPVCDLAMNPPVCRAICDDNDDCTQYDHESWCNLTSGSCIAAECENDWDCVGNPNGPACLVGSRMCVDCIVDEHCTEPGLMACDSPSNECVECVDNWDCSGAKPACAVADHRCVECVYDGDCPVGLTCNPSTSVCVACMEDADCTSPTAPACDTARNVCVGCLADADCAAPNVCDPASRTCVRCVEDVDCPVNKTCDTSNRVCVDCVSDRDCPASMPACSTATRTCVACTRDAHCGALAPGCDLNTNTCVQCTKSSHCDGGKGACDVNHHVCKECVTDADCDDSSMPACDPLSGNCVACFSHDHCLSQGLGACDIANRVCVDCASDSDCTEPGLTACNLATHTCVGCTTNAHCGVDVCDTATNSCLECLSNKHCKNPKVPICDTRAGTPSCVECLHDSHCHKQNKVCDEDGSCVECLKSTDCWLRNPTKPICGGDKTCVACTDDIICAGNFLHYQSCDIGSGACVADSYAKGFYVSSIVLGSVAVFFVIVAVIAILAGAK